MSGQGFADLRLNHQRDQTSETFWPSFTDVMTVIVMIFLLAMLILLLRNMELVADLRTTMEAERQAAELVRARDRERVELSERLTAAQAEIGGLADRIAALEVERAEQLQALSEARDRIGSLSAERQTLMGDLTEQQRRAGKLHATLDEVRGQLADLETGYGELTARYQDMREELAAAGELAAARQAELRRFDAEAKSQQAEIEQLEAARRELAALYATGREELITVEGHNRQLQEEVKRLQADRQSSDTVLEQLRSAYAERAAELAAALDKLDAADRSRSELTEEYSQLRERYDRLVQPARSPTGRFVVEVRYAKIGGRADIRYREPGSNGFTAVSRAELEQRLTELSRKHDEGLYVRIIFPENSGLSYNEAWGFTNAIHGKYDYYYRDRPDAQQEPSPEEPR